MLTRFVRAAAACAVVWAAFAAPAVQAQSPSRNLAAGFTARPAASTIALVPADMELFAVSAGGVAEPRADWTAAARGHFRTALMGRSEFKGPHIKELKDAELDEMGQLNALHATVAEAVFVHHMMKMPPLPTKNDVLDWTLGDAVAPLRARTGADYALFFWVRDSYATAERKAAMVAMTLIGAAFGVAVIPAGGHQIAYASLVDLKTGRLVWFNTLARASGDLREAEPALETVQELLKSFPPAQ